MSIRISLIAVGLLLVIAAPASAATTVWLSFNVEPGHPAGVSAVGGNWTMPKRLDVVRGGTVVATATSTQTMFPAAFVELESLQAGDVANFYSGNALTATATYDGLPSVEEDACAGSSKFTTRRTPGSAITGAGAWAPGAGNYVLDGVRAIWTQDNPSTVTLERPLALGEIAYAASSLTVGETEIRSSRGATVGACRVQAPVPATAPTPAPSVTPAKASLATTSRRLRTLTLNSLARRKSVALPFAFPERGTVRLRLVSGPAAARRRAARRRTAARTSPSS